MQELNGKNGKKISRAAAIKYEPGTDEVPVLAAFGEGYVAEKIVSVAKQAGVKIVEDPSLASMLSKMSVGDQIPEELYEVVARVLIFVSDVDKNYGARLKSAIL
jgi:flagellar biosynthesis protein